MTTTDPAVGVIVVAAGSGSRLGNELPKAFVEVAGRTILERCLRSVFAIGEECQVVVAAPAAFLEEARRIAGAAAGVAVGSVIVVAGGDSRQQSVAAGLAQLAPGVDVVLVHDAARALTPVAQLEAVIAGVRATGGGIIPGLPVTDTIKRVDAAAAALATGTAPTPGTAPTTVVGTVDRSTLVAVQTPQGFPRAQLEAAYVAADDDHTDDAALFAAAGHRVSTIPGDPLAFKITTPWDLRRAELLEQDAEGQGGQAPTAAAPTGPTALVPTTMRTGVGIDVHAFDESVDLWLGGLHWPGEPGLAGHSDGDAACHALCDALLSAAGLGDIGGNFGTADPAFANARGEVFVRATVSLLAAHGFTIGNAAVQLIGNRPRVAPRRVEMEQLLTSLVGAPVSVSATTTDGLGFTGRGEGVCAVVTVLIHSRPES